MIDILKIKRLEEITRRLKDKGYKFITFNSEEDAVSVFEDVFCDIKTHFIKRNRIVIPCKAIKKLFKIKGDK
jgi:hypothetical protein